MTQIYNGSNISTFMNNEHNDYGQFWDTEDQRPVYQTSISIDNNDEYEYYINDYEMKLTQQENMLEHEYNKEYNSSTTLFSTLGFIIFIVKTVAGFIYK